MDLPSCPLHKTEVHDFMLCNNQDSCQSARVMASFGKGLDSFTADDFLTAEYD